MKKFLPYLFGLAFLFRAMRPPNIFNLIPAEIHRSLFKNIFPEVVTIFLFNLLIALFIFSVSKKIITAFSNSKVNA
ncbi:hypothetical protein [Gracilimonas sp.]